MNWGRKSLPGRLMTSIRWRNAGKPEPIISLRIIRTISSRIDCQDYNDISPGIPYAECHMQNTKCGIPYAGCYMRDAICGKAYAGYHMRNTTLPHPQLYPGRYIFSKKAHNIHILPAGRRKWRKDYEITEAYWNHTGWKPKVGFGPGDGEAGWIQTWYFTGNDAIPYVPPTGY